MTSAAPREASWISGSQLRSRHLFATHHPQIQPQWRSRPFLDPTTHDMVCMAKATSNDVTTKEPRLCHTHHAAATVADGRTNQHPPRTTDHAHRRQPPTHTRHITTGRRARTRSAPHPATNGALATRDTQQGAAPNHSPRGAASVGGQASAAAEGGPRKGGTVRGPQSAREAPRTARTAPHERYIRTRKRHRARRPRCGCRRSSPTALTHPHSATPSPHHPPPSTSTSTAPRPPN
ncbi:hypothetical protein BJ912DRAFT_81329 [Pholiota molesta]|nr:hypothetical protein BJ912DRAFT_81329 [Pholiota molesta]